MSWFTHEGLQLIQLKLGLYENLQKNAIFLGLPNRATEIALGVVWQ